MKESRRKRELRSFLSFILCIVMFFSSTNVTYAFEASTDVFETSTDEVDALDDPLSTFDVSGALDEITDLEEPYSLNEMNSVYNAAGDTERFAGAMKTYLDAINAAFFNTGTEQNPINFWSVKGMILRGLPTASFACSGTISMLEAIGVVKSPMSQGFDEIKDGINNLNTKMDALEIEVKNVSEQIRQTSKFEKEKARQDSAAKYLAAWYKFKTDYVDDMERISAEIQSFTRKGVKDWWERENHSSVSVIYAIPKKMPGEDYDPTPCIAFSKESYNRSTLIDKSDANEDVLEDYSFIIPEDCLPDTSKVLFDVNDYEDKFCNATDGIGKVAIKNALESKKITANEKFYISWNGIPEAEKDKKASEYATDLLKTIIYQENCRIMSAENVKVSNYIVKYQQYCNNIKLKQSGVDAFIQNLYMTHGFEGQVEKDIEAFCNSQIKDVGTYGLLIMTAAAQCNLATEDEHNKLYDAWATTIEFLDKKRDDSLTGYDDFCYITGTRLTYASGVVATELGIKYYDGRRYDGYVDKGYTLADSYDENNWVLVGTLNRNQMISDEHAKILYDQYVQNSDGASSFIEYINNNGVKAPDSGDVNIVTGIATEPTPFELAKGTELTVSMELGDWLTYGSKQTVNKIKKCSDKYFVIHDLLKYDEVNLKDVANGCTNDKTLLVRALYGESHRYWPIDEAYTFCSNDANIHFVDPEKDGKLKTHKRLMVKKFNYVRKTPVAALKNLGMDNVFMAPNYGETNDEDVVDRNAADDERVLDDSSPLLVFGGAYILADEPDEEEIPYSKADFSTLKWDNLRLIGFGDNVDKQIAQEIENEIEYANAAGMSVSLTAEEKKGLADEMSAYLAKVEDVLQKSNSIGGVNIFNIDGNDELEKNLAKKTLPASYFRNGECIIPPENMTVVLEYEPYIFIKFEDVDGKVSPVVNPGYEIVPSLVVWDSRIEAFEGYQISEDVYVDLGMEMDAIIPVGEIVKGNCIGVSCYASKDMHDQGVKKNYVTLGEKDHKYVKIHVDNDMLYELRVNEFGDQTGVWVDRVPDQKYTGKAIMPEIKLYDGEKELKKNIDYTVNYENNVNAGTANIKITCKGNYSGEANVTFNILPRDMSELEVNYIDCENIPNPGKAVKIFSNVKDGKKALNGDGIDYSVKYLNKADGKEVSLTDIPAGTYRMVVTGCNNYTGKYEAEFEMLPKDVIAMSKAKVTLTKKGMSYGENDAPKVKSINVGGKTYTENGPDKIADVFDIMYPVNGNEIGSYQIVVKAKAGNPAKIGGSKRVKYNVNKLKLNKTMFKITGSYVYNGLPIDPTFETELKSGTDFEVSAVNNNKAGKAYAVFSGIGNYTGSVKVPFTIKKYDIKNVSISVNGVSEFNKAGAKADITATAENIMLLPGRDYTISYKDNKKLGTATATLKGKGNFEGSNSVSFEIGKASISSNTISVNIKDIVYANNKSTYKPTVTVKQSKKALKNNTDYTVTYENDGTVTEQDMAKGYKEIKVTIKAAENSCYTGERTEKFTVFLKGKEASKLTGTVIDQHYRSGYVTISANAINLKDKDGNAIPAQDISIISYKNNKKVGNSASVSFKVKGFGGIKTLKFKILPKTVK